MCPAVENHAEDDIENRQHGDQHDRRQFEAVDESSERPRQAGKPHRQREERGTHQNQRDHRRSTCRPHQARAKRLNRQQAQKRR